MMKCGNSCYTDCDNEGFWTPDKDTISGGCGFGYKRKPDGEFHRIGPNCATWPSVLTEHPYQRPELAPRFSPILHELCWRGQCGGAARSTSAVLLQTPAAIRDRAGRAGCANGTARSQGAHRGA